MQYVSTRGAAPILGFDEVLLSGLARDGGLYLPEAWPRLSEADLRALAGRPYAEVAARVMQPFVQGSLLEDRFEDLVAESYADFGHAAVAPLRQLEANLWLLELFHGPTLAFKDVALQLLGRLFDALLAARGLHVTIVAATSGDTGAAAIEACRDRQQLDIVVLHPKGRVSEVQRRQMTTVTDANVHNVAIEGTFDDCQDLVKALFNDAAFRDEMHLSAVNSINWARIMAQIVYYVTAALALGAPARNVAFTVPTGNFGNVLAGYAARRMGLPVTQLVVASNRNDILTRFLESGTMAIEEVQPTLSPSMDIQVASNFERLLFELLERDGGAVANLLQSFRASGRFSLDGPHMGPLLELFDGFRLDDEGTLAEIRRRWEETGEPIDPHGAVGTAAARAQRHDHAVPMVALATAHPAKFPDAVERATGRRPGLPARLADLYEREERCAILPNDVARLQRHIRSTVRARGAAA